MFVEPVEYRVVNPAPLHRLDQRDDGALEEFSVAIHDSLELTCDHGARRPWRGSRKAFDVDKKSWGREVGANPGWYVDTRCGPGTAEQIG